MAIPVLFIVGFLKNHWDTILLVLLAIAITTLIAGVWIRGSHWESKFHKEVASHAETLNAHNVAVANAAMETARAERIERDREQALQEAADAARRKDAEMEAMWQARLAEQLGRDGARRKQLLDHVGRLTNHISTSESRKDPVGTIVDLQNRLTTCGQFLGRADSLAERCAVSYGTVRNAWEECSRDSKAIREGVVGSTQ